MLPTRCFQAAKLNHGCSVRCWCLINASTASNGTEQEINIRARLFASNTTAALRCSIFTASAGSVE